LGLDATVCLYPGTGINIFGHVGVGINSDQTFGKYPSNDPNRDGEIKKDDKYPPKFCKVIETNPEQDSAMLKEIALQMTSLSTGYKLLGDSCVDFVLDVLKQGGVDCPNATTPEELMEHISSNKCK
jgi:hypothetical protein